MRQKSAEITAFSHYLRTGRHLPPPTEEKFNPYHDPDDGRFTFAPGNLGAGSSPTSSPSGSSRSSAMRSASASDPIGDIIRRSQQPRVTSRPREEASPAPKPGSLSHWPIAGASVSSLNRADKPGEGEPYYRSKRGKGKHGGVDIKAPEGTPVQSAADGVVVRITPNPSISFGQQVVIYHGNGVFTQYAHLQPGSVIVRPRDRVSAGQPIARVGRTGNTPRTGDAHLHFEVRIGSSAPAVAGGHTRNPLEYLPR